MNPNILETLIQKVKVVLLKDPCIDLVTVNV